MVTKVVIFLIIRWLVAGGPGKTEVLRFVDTAGRTADSCVVDGREEVVGKSDEPNLS